MSWILGKGQRPKENQTVDLRGEASRAEERRQLPEAFALWLRLAEAGDAEAAYAVGDRYERGVGVLQSFTEATEWYRRSAEKGWVPAYSKLGDIYFTGRRSTLDAPEGKAPLSQKSAAFATLAARAAGIEPDYPEAAKWNLIAAEQGDAKAQVRIAYQYASKLGVEQDYTAAERWFSKAADQEESGGQLGLGMILAGGHGRSRDPAAAARFFERAVAQGNSSAKLCLAVLLEQGSGITKDHKRAFVLLQEAAESRLPEAMFRIGEYRRFGIGCTKDDSEAETWLRRAAHSGHTGAMVAAGILLRDRATPDFNSAAAFFIQGADLGDGDAQFALADLFLKGHGVPKDSVQAAFWYKKAANRGVISAYQRLGAMYADGIGLPQDFVAAANWFGKAAASGQHTAYYHMGTIQHYGLGVPPNPHRALEHYNRASDEGDWRASLRLGVLYAQGELVDQDWEEAARFYGKAAAQGSSDAEMNLAFLMIRNLVPGGPPLGIKLLRDSANSGNLQAIWSLYRLYSDDIYIPIDLSEGDKWLLLATELGSPLAIAELGRILLNGRDAVLSPTKILALLEVAAQAGDPSSQSVLGRLSIEGKYNETDTLKAMSLFKKAATGGDVFAQAWLGDVLSTGQFGQTNLAEAAHWYSLAAEQGHIGSLLAITSAAPPPGANPEVDTKIVELWQRLASSGNALAQRMIGDFRATGTRCARSVSEGVLWLRKSSSQGNSAAKKILAAVLLQQGIEQEYPSEALDLLREAAATGDVEALHNLGVCYRMGIGVEPNYQIAQSWHRLAATKNHAHSQLALGDLLIEAGSGETFSEALNWYQLAANAGLAEAALRLGRFHEAHLGRGSDPALASRYFRQAAEGGLEEGTAGLRRSTSSTR